MGNFIFGGGSRSLNGGGLLVSPAVKSSSTPALSFVSQPQSKTVDGYALATFSCEVAGGTAPYSYQWKKNGTNVGTNSANLSLTAAAADKNASITVVVTDSAGAIVTSTPVALGVTSYAYQLDSLTSKFILSSPITVAIGDKITVNVICSPNTVTGSNYSRFIGSEDFTITVDTGIDGNKFRLLGCTAKLDGVSIVSDVTPIPTDLIARDLDVTLTRSGTIAAIAGLKDTSGRSINAKMRYLSFTRAAGNIFIPLNKVSQGGTQLPTVGTISALILNYNPAGWVAI